MIYGPQYNHSINRIRPIDPDCQDDQKDEKKRRVRYQGRDWMESSEDEPLVVQQAMTQSHSLQSTQKKGPLTCGVYADKILLTKAEKLFKNLTTLEEKAAQLCFLLTQAIYNAESQYQTELLIQTWQIGGLLFNQGEYLRQAYLIERHQKVSKTPLLMANTFFHGLSLYFGEKPITIDHCFELGKNVMSYNRQLGVHVQFTCKGSHLNPISMNEKEVKAFNKGIREGDGVVGKERDREYTPTKETVTALSLKKGLFVTKPAEHQVQERIGFKTLTFFDASELNQSSMDDVLISGFKQQYDLFLLSGNIAGAIQAIVRLVRTGRISEELLDRHVMKVLIIKALNFSF